MVRNFAIALIVVVAGIGVWLAWPTDDTGTRVSRSGIAPETDEKPKPVLEDVAGSGPSGEAESLVRSTDESDLDLGLGESAIEGTVTDPFGAAAAGAYVTLYKSDLSDLEKDGGAEIFDLVERNFRSLGSIRAEIRERVEPFARVRADGAGHYSFRGIESGEYLVAGSASGFLATPAARVSYLEGQSRSADIELLHAGRLTGRVLDPSLAGVAAAQLRVSGELIDEHPAPRRHHAVQ